MQRPDIGILKTFVAVVEASGFSRAAQKLETTPGAVSRRVAALEGPLSDSSLVTRSIGEVKRTLRAALDTWKCGVSPGRRTISSATPATLQQNLDQRGWMWRG